MAGTPGGRRCPGCRAGSGAGAEVGGARHRPPAGTRTRWPASALGKKTGRKSRALINNWRVGRIRFVYVETPAVGTDRVRGSAYLDGLGLIERADNDWRRTEEVHHLVAWQCVEHHRGDVVGHLGVHRFGYARRIDPSRYDSRGDETHHGRA